MRLLGYVTLVLAAAGVARGTVGEGPVVKQEHVNARLVTAASAVTPGGTLPIAIEFEIEKDWHIYWRDGGSTGLPTTVDFKLPPGWRVSPLQYPTPIGH